MQIVTNTISSVVSPPSNNGQLIINSAVVANNSESNGTTAHLSVIAPNNDQPLQSLSELQLEASVASSIQQTNNINVQNIDAARGAETASSIDNNQQQDLLKINSLTEQGQKISQRRQKLEEEKTAIEDALQSLSQKETEINRQKFRLKQSLGTLINISA